MKELVYFIVFQLSTIKASLNRCVFSPNTCSAFGKWDKTLDKCQCSNLFWGDYCEFGRKRLTAEKDRIVESEYSYHCMSKYMYLIDAQNQSTSIQLNIEKFRTECNWDHLYIFDGRSIYDPLIASLSGIIQSDTLEDRYIRSHSGALFLYFFSDLNINEQGYNFTYVMSECNSSYCNNHGFCHTNRTCSCDDGWTGSTCQQQLCCENHFDVISHRKTKLCKNCNPGSVQVTPRASHATVVIDGKIWLYGGYSFNEEKHFDSLSSLFSYDFITYSWKEVSKSTFGPLSGHTLVAFGKSLIVHGGKTLSSNISCLTWKYHIETNSWRKITAKNPVCVFGHASVVAGNSMFVFFGYNEIETLTSSVQKLNLDKETWSVVETQGAKVKGRFGHSANYDYDTGIVYIFGGFIVRHIVNELLLYHVAEAKWSIGPPALSPVTLHSGTFIGSNLLIFGGNRYNGSDSRHQICHSKDLSVYNLDCKKWELVNTSTLLESQDRYGHSAVVYKSSLFIFGGYNGELKNDILKILIIDDPSKYTTQESCLSTPLITGLVWSKKSKCLSSPVFLPESDIVKRTCSVDLNVCSSYASCSKCVNAGCEWWWPSTNKCIPAKQIQTSSNQQTLSMCDDQESFMCSLNQNCKTCNEKSGCVWNMALKLCTISSTSATRINTKQACYGDENVTSCEAHKSCRSCLSMDNSQCIWCESQNECIQANTYTVTYAYGQCYEWVSGDANMCKALNCSSQTTCHKCFQQPGCGWCSDGPNSGLGECMEGSQLSPKSNMCPSDRWHFTECPACYCNGHSGCRNGTGTCERCYGHVTGSHCEVCEPGYFGDPERNGTCSKCYCNGHYRACDAKSGKCECNLKGAIGDQCQLCDRGSNYYGNASNNGLCYFLMIVDYHYRSNLTKVTEAAFLARPKSRSSSLEFKVTHASGAFGYMNVSLHYSNGHTRMLTTNHLIGVYRVIIEKEDYEYPDEDVELRFIVFGWNNNEHFAFKATLTHPPKVFDLVYFLIMFLVCFCGLLLLLIIIWKVKQRYDICVRRRRDKYEMRERISRPSKSIKINIRHKPPEIYQKIVPTLICSEEFSSGHLSVGTFLIEYPRDQDGYPPAGSSGLAFGCTLLNTNTKRTFPHKHRYSHNKTRKRQNVSEIEL